jgi:D-amino-acid dehydrogenase
MSRGASLRIGEAVRIEPINDGARVVLADGAVFDAKTVVLAGGAWSKTIVAGLGDHAPLETERGYNTTLPQGAFPLHRQLYFNDHGFVVTPLSSGIRVGGAVELGGLKLAPNYKRSEAMLKKAKSFLPELRTEGGRQWMGFRPSMPDCLPVISASTATAGDHLRLRPRASRAHAVSCDRPAGRGYRRTPKACPRCRTLQHPPVSLTVGDGGTPAGYTCRKSLSTN